MFLKEFKIGNTYVGDDHPAYIIAEIGANFNGSLDHAKRLCDAAKKLELTVQNFNLLFQKKLYQLEDFLRWILKEFMAHGTKP